MAQEHADAWKAGGDETTVRRGFWKKAKRVGANLPFTEDLLAAYYCALDQETPLRVQAMLMGALAYFVVPVDFVPDFFPALGFTDDAAVVAATIKLVIDHMRPEHREAAKQTLERH